MIDFKHIALLAIALWAVRLVVAVVREKIK